MSNLINANIINRVFHIAIDEYVGTCFTIEIDNRQYIITAKHLAERIKYPNEIGIFYKNNWENINVNLVGFGEYNEDVSVLATDFQISPTFPIRFTGAESAYSQEVFFLGFPLGLITTDSEINRNFPFPLVKKGIFSGTIDIEGCKVCIIDGINNPGFSGGPVICVPPNRQQNDFQIMSIISGYEQQFEKTLINNKETDIIAPLNSGLIISYPIEIAIRIIKSNPIGILVKN
jgi:hypothetical protein